MGDGVIYVFIVFFFKSNHSISCWVSCFCGGDQAVHGQPFTDPPDLFRKDAGLIQSLTGINILIVVLWGGRGWLPLEESWWCQQSRSGSRSKVSLICSKRHTSSRYLKCGFINNSISFNEHCRYIIENKSRNRRDVVSRVVKVPGIILCYMLLIIIIVTKKCSIHRQTM